MRTAENTNPASDMPTAMPPAIQSIHRLGPEIQEATNPAARMIKTPRITALVP